MMMKLRPTHIPDKILEARRKRIPEEVLLAQVREIFEKQAGLDMEITNRLQDGDGNDSNDFDLDKLESHRIFHLSDIEKTCIEYRLRFLNSAYFKAKMPYEAISRIKELEKQHHTTLRGFRIMAPATLFKLENADDPLLFAPIGNDYYYLIHSWGKDLHPFRKLLMWPFRQLENFMFFLLLLSLFLTFLVPQGMFSPQQTTTEFFIIFFFMFKWVTALAIFYGFKFGKNFSSAIWQSKYYNA
ncbi:hypothetical protein FHG64_16290 [Antarcticibacterium flavum]|uniref:Uncharacterized protein n=1 Tax=Antarcticibacterium flavum TaxID=2058175 RepID=A0A5B7X602_9FLAO|nr:MULTISPECIES: hypothetical protein [Antarcticibacterium]MCM4159575.1 hypothetical protein [Antarcticibacterium sp. W02-3]QCY70827.1 hypothetical protein FHG64_16290 [Antarcticibacterium flavum]